MRQLIHLGLIFIISLAISSPVLAQSQNQFITIVNPVRISAYNPSPAESLSSQYSVISRYNFPATWLLTYDALSTPGIIDVLNDMDSHQEFGIFLEVTASSAQASGVKYNESGSWHFANSVFLSGYTQEERIKLIDTVFSKFKSVFGAYPSSVGSWWTDGYSLAYMHKKYSVTANLTVADQFSTDNYQVWGQYWSTPFYPSVYHAGTPASTNDTKLNVVNLQWAARDPLNGYYSSLYSTQDYPSAPISQDTSYFAKLLHLYLDNPVNSFGQITVGLEADLTPAAYLGEFSSQLDSISQLSQVRVTSMKDFSQWYRDEFPNLSPAHVIQSSDLLGSNKKQFWYQSPHYRIGILIDQDLNLTKIIDFRSYHTDLQEPYYSSPNRDRDLRIYIPSYIDSLQNPQETWSLNLGKFQDTSGTNEKFAIAFSKGHINLSSDYLQINSPSFTFPESISKSEILKTEKNSTGYKITPSQNWSYPVPGLVFKDFTPVATHLLKSPRLLLKSLFTHGLSDLKKTDFLVGQSELDALFRLSVLPPGRVLVLDRECLQCSWHGPFRPAVFANHRQYVSRLSHKPIIYNSSVFSASTRSQAKSELDKLHVKYLYLTRYEDYIESPPFSPGDLNIEKIYSNANAQIWRIKT